MTVHWKEAVNEWAVYFLFKLSIWILFRNLYSPSLCDMIPLLCSWIKSILWACFFHCLKSPLPGFLFALSNFLYQRFRGFLIFHIVTFSILKYVMKIVQLLKVLNMLQKKKQWIRWMRQNVWKHSRISEERHSKENKKNIQSGLLKMQDAKF